MDFDDYVRRISHILLFPMSLCFYKRGQAHTTLNKLKKKKTGWAFPIY